MIENIEDVFYRSDAEERLLMTSPSGARLFGYDSVEEMIGLPLDSFWVDPQERQRLISMVKEQGKATDFEGVPREKMDRHLWRHCPATSTETIMAQYLEQRALSMNFRSQANRSGTPSIRRCRLSEHWLVV